jgi:putative peptidoglycan lipid II flippase
MFNVATILCVIAVVPLMPSFGLPPVAGIAIGTLLGGVGQIALQWPALHRQGFRYQPVLDFKDPELREILRLMVPGTLGLAAVQVNVFVNTYLATTQPEGSVSWLSYAFRLMYLPIGLFGVSIATAALPDIARQAGASDRLAVRQTVSRGLRLMLMLNVPATVGLVVLSQPIVELIYERGEFTSADSVATAAALMFYAPGLLGYSAVKIASPTFYSLRDSRTPVIVSVASVAANLALNLILVEVMGFRGLALGTSIAAVFNAVILLTLLSRRLGGLDAGRIAGSGLRIAAASAVMGIVVWYVSAWLTAAMPGPGFGLKLARVGISIAAGLGALLVSGRVLRIEELDDALGRVVARVRR